MNHSKYSSAPAPWGKRTVSVEKRFTSELEWYGRSAYCHRRSEALGGSHWLNGSVAEPLRPNEMVRDRLRESLWLVIPELAGVAVGAVKGIRVYMATHRSLAENQHRDGGEEPPAETGSLVSRHSFHLEDLKIFQGPWQER